MPTTTLERRHDGGGQGRGVVLPDRGVERELVSIGALPAAGLAEEG